MTTMRHCRVHGRYSDPDGDGCWECRQAERQAEESLSEITDRLRDSKDYGDYICPHCLYRTLRAYAHKCPQCHGMVEDKSWEWLRKESREREVKNKEREKRERQEEERKAQADLIQRAKNEEENKKREKRKKFFFWYLGYILPTITLLSVAFIDARRGTSFAWCSLFIPCYNWLIVTYVMFEAKGFRALTWTALLVWFVVGLFLEYSLQKDEKPS